MKNWLLPFLILVVACGAVVAAVIWGPQLFKGYTATAILKRTSESTWANEKSIDKAEQSDFLMGERRVIKSLYDYDFKNKAAISQLIDDVDALHADLPVTDEDMLTDDGRIRFEQLVNDLRDAIDVTTEELDDGYYEELRINVTMKDGELAAVVANTLMERYLKTVRTEIDDSLIQKRKFFSSEVTRRKRQISELNTAMLRFDRSQASLGVESMSGLMENPDLFFAFIQTVPRLEAKRDVLTSKIKHLIDIYKDKPLAERAAVQMADWKGERDGIDAEIELLGSKSEEIEKMNRGYSSFRNEWLKITQDLEEAHKQLAFWEKRLRETQVALTMAVSERGMNMNVVEHAVGPPRKPRR